MVQRLDCRIIKFLCRHCAAFSFCREVVELAATRLIALHKNKGKSVAACLKSRTDYAQNPDKTQQGELVSSYECSPLTVDEEFMLSKRQYELATGRRQKSDVIAYQIRQSFKPGEITAEEANKVGYELAERFLKGKHAFIVATHTDRAHVHNHIIYNSTALDGTRKFRDFLLSGLAVQRLSDLICLEHQLSVIEIKPYRERQKRTLYPPRESNRDMLYMTTGKDASEAVVAAACGSIFAANVAVLYLLERMEKTAENQERVLALEQQLQFQAKNMEAASQLYTAQRHKVHDFRAHLNILQGLLQNQEYDAAEQYLNSVTKEQTDRLFLVNSHHSILDALFNTKATEAIRKGIDIDFKLNDLSTLPFDVSDMVVLFSNLLDNAIEACEKVDGNRVIRVSVVLKRSLLFSIRNTTLPVKIKNDTIQTTKPNASLHGFGLSNIKLILNKYHADFVMDYTDGWFQFTGEIEI